MAQELGAIRGLADIRVLARPLLALPSSRTAPGHSIQLPQCLQVMVACTLGWQRGGRRRAGVINHHS